MRTDDIVKNCFVPFALAFSIATKNVYESLEETFIHLKNLSGAGDGKFMKEESYRVELGNNTIMVITDKVKTVFLNYDALNYISTRDEAFCNYCHEYLQKLIKKSTIKMETIEKQRNIFLALC